MSGVGEIRIDAESALECLFRFFEPAGSCQEHAEIAPTPLVGGTPGEQVPIQTLGSVVSAQALERIRKIVHGICVVRITSKSGLIFGDCLLITAGPCKNDSQVVVSERKIIPQSDGFSERFFRPP